MEVSQGDGRFTFPNRRVVMKKQRGEQGGEVRWPRKNVFCTARILGSGSFSSVFEGTFFDRPAAIKVHRAEAKFTEYAAPEEAAVLKRLHHPNICELLAAFNSTNHEMPVVYVIVMPRYGENLYKRMQRYRLEDECVPDQDAIVLALLDAVEYLDEERVVHMDIKPENVVFKDDSTPVLIDFNTYFDLRKGDEEVLLSHPVAPYMVTRLYRSPTLLLGAKNWIPAAQMMWPVAVIAFEMARWGKPPWPGKNNLHMAHLIEHDLQAFKGQMPECIYPFKWRKISSGPVPADDLPFYDPTIHRPILDILLEHVFVWHDKDRASATEVKRIFAEETKSKEPTQQKDDAGGAGGDDPSSAPGPKPSVDNCAV